MSEPVAIIKSKPGGLIYMATPDGEYFDISKYVGASLYTDAAIAELLVALNYVMNDEPSGIPRASSSCRKIVSAAITKYNGGIL